MRMRRALLALSFGFAVLGVQHGEAAVPALYTAGQARSGYTTYEQKCAMCHGKHEQGMVGPALKGPVFASKKANYKVEDIYLFMSVNMPAYAPGSLTPKQYVDIMAFLLHQNGFPAGPTALTSQLAGTSTVPLLYHATKTAPGTAPGTSGVTAACPRAKTGPAGTPSAHCKKAGGVHAEGGAPAP